MKMNQRLGWVTSVALCNTRLFVNFRYAPFTTEVLWRCNMSRRANSSRFSKRLATCEPGK